MNRCTSFSVLIVGMFALALSGCYSNSLNVPHQKVDSDTEFITTRNADKAIDECDRLISLYKEELQKIENKEETLDSGMIEKNEIVTINKLNQKLYEKIGILENNSSAFTAEQIERFKVMQERYYFHVTRPPFED